MAFYPYTYVATKNVKQALVPASSIDVYVYELGGAGEGSQKLKSIYTSVSGGVPSLIQQPLVTDTNGQIQFYAEPGRIRLDTIVDSALTISHNDVIVDQDNIIVGYLNTTVTPLPNNSTKTFTLSEVPAGGKASVYVDGLRFRQTASSTTNANEYSLSGAMINFGQAPSTGAVIIVDIWK